MTDVTVTAAPQIVLDPSAAVRAEPDRPLPREARTVIVGAGFAGMGLAIGLDEAGDHDYLLLDAAGEVGGTWRDNTYPGAACDVPSRLYSYSFAQNPSWTRSFSRQPEIQRYLVGVADRYGVRGRFHGGVVLTAASWDEAAQRWDVETSAGPVRCRFLVLATGALSAPKAPVVPGLDTFPGPVFHTARWDHEVDLTGKRVAVVGTGASAIQVVPAIAERVGHLTLFQRTPPWVLPRPDRPFTGGERTLHRMLPAVTRLVRSWLYYSHEAITIGLVREPRLMKVAQRAARRHIAQQVADPQLREVLTPTFTLGCKRMLLSNDYYPALVRDDVTVVPGGLAEVEGDTLVGADGSRTQVDVVILATGFDATEPPVARAVHGRDGTLAERFAEHGMQALRGLTFAGFPNLFMLVGPNTGVGHTSMVQIIESQVTYLLAALRGLDEQGAASMEPREPAVASWNADLQRRMAGTVWQQGGCASWYQDSHGRNTTLWPGSTIRFRHQLQQVDWGEYAVR